jgi:cytochrome c peroxidase
VGGNFWNGRATGEVLGNPAADQALGPFTNPVEQALGNEAAAVAVVCTSDYADDFKSVWGAVACVGDVDGDYGRIALSVAEYEDSYEVNAFNSKSDLAKRGDAKLTKLEREGRALFKGKGKCRLCHLSNGQQPLYTDFTFDNLGVPKNPENPVYDYNPGFIDEGLGGFLKDAGYDEDVYMAEWGKQKVPTLRNVDLRPNESDVKAYSHNGYFKSLEGIVHFYNTRDVKPECPGDYTEAQALAADCWPPPEVAVNVNVDELGNLGLTLEEEEAIVAFMKTLSDGFVPPEG